MKADKYAFVFNNYNFFLADDLVSKGLFLEILKEEVLPWWENDAKKYVVGGVAKALEDFNSLNLENVTEINTSFGKGYRGALDDGTKVVVRPTNKEGIQH
ncbi:hypothetical protein HMPREF9182_1673 [Streptococcus sp. oral taxon 056 str. F0418]|uniref:hypothetical protein n=1 Tax=Streptococcus sp. oral taxon 056 TaxID=712620 RepID=UPI00021813F7|nr:hypothetical protein [Streptococcus sp. oral taxon 056]EGP65845.1 hypothetical protein HMPREF9182_1673 [Streptococcus sp. oral taxon 056 str. F0418]